jgi:hypothetical protein
MLGSQLVFVFLEKQLELHLFAACRARLSRLDGLYHPSLR